MKSILKQIAFIVAFFICADCFSQSKQTTEKISYDSLLAKKLGADEYGMKKYVFAFLRSGPIKINDSVTEAKLQFAHLKNIQRLADEGKLIVAGPFLDNQKTRGIFIFNVETMDEAKKLIETDPAVRAGVLEMELHPWYGSAALIETLKIHRTIEKNNIAE